MESDDRHGREYGWLRLAREICEGQKTHISLIVQNRDKIQEQKTLRGQLQFANPFILLVGEGGFEPPTSYSRSRRANQSALLPEKCANFLGYNISSRGTRKEIEQNSRHLAYVNLFCYTHVVNRNFGSR